MSRAPHPAPDLAGHRLMTSEAQLLLCCSRAQLPAATAHRIRELASGPLDWDGLCTLAAAHCVLPLLFTHLNAVAQDLVPPATLGRLRDAFARNARHSLLLASELQKIVSLFESHGIPVLPYKGPVLAQQLYGNIALRQMIDLDVLVPRSCVKRARSLLRTHGYAAVDLQVPGIEGIILRSECNIGFVRLDPPLTVELHWAFTSGRFWFPMTCEELVARTTRLTCGRAELPALDPGDLLVILCFHGSKHMWERLEWIAGVGETLKRPDIEWARVIDTARRLGCLRMVLLGTALARDLLEAPVPAALAERIAEDSSVATLAATIRARLFTGTTHLAHQSGMAYHRFHIRVKERLREKVRYAWFAIVVPEKEDWLALPLPDTWHPLYYVIRPFRLMGQYGLRLARSRP